ncbi:MAG: replication-relaxation family protein [Nocardioides sp.]
MNARLVASIGERLSDRDEQILSSLEQFRLLDTRMVQRLHFGDHASDLAALRATARTMQRLETLDVVSALQRRIGGVRKGSASYVWQLAATGERYLRTNRGHAHRRRFIEPGAQFVNHTLAVNDLAVGLLEARRDVDGFTIERLVTEPANWRSYLGPAGETTWLKPDLYTVTTSTDADGDYEEHAFLEIDLGTEHLPRIQAKCRRYDAYFATGAYQAAHGLFPAVIWLSPDPRRRAALKAAIAATAGLPAGLFRVTSPQDYLTDITGASDITVQRGVQQPGGQEGGPQTS